MVSIQSVLRFWFGDPDSPDYGKSQPRWFKKDPQFDEQIRQQFLPLYDQAVAATLTRWLDQADSCLALILVLDQFPRNIFRGNAQSFATDPQALSAAHHAIQRKFDQELSWVQRGFFYLPLEHSEVLADQQQSVQLFEKLAADFPNPDTIKNLDYAIRHRQIIEHFGRFPHRNDILGRCSTAAEHDFLAQPGSGF